jgi:hypothetical protein
VAARLARRLTNGVRFKRMEGRMRRSAAILSAAVLLCAWPQAAEAAPVVLAAVGSALGGAIAGLKIGTIIALTALSAALAGVSMLLAPKPPEPNLAGFAGRSQGRTRQIRQPITPWKWVLGDMRVSGPITFLESTDDDKYLHMVITLACHSCAAWKTFYLNEYPIYPEQLDGDGLVTEGRYDGLVKLQVDLGTTGAQPFPDLASAASGWSSAHRQDGHTKLYVRLEFDRDVFPSGIPDISIRLRGRNDIEDTRDASTGYSCNPALLARRYMTLSEQLTGMNVPAAQIDDSETDASANVCDEIVDAKSITHTVATVNVGTGSPPVGGSFDLNGDALRFMTGDRVEIASAGTLPGGFTAATSYYVIADREAKTDEAALRIRLAASLADAYAETAIDVTSAGSGSISIEKTGEPRYTAHGIIETDREPAAIIEDLRSAMAGWIVNVGGEWQIRAGRWESAALTLDEDDLAGPISMRTRTPRRERFNAVKGVYVSPLNYGQASDYPPVTNSVYQTADGGDRVFNELDLPFTSRPQTAQRIATVQLQRHRREIEVTLQLNLIGVLLSVGDVVALSLERYGWTAKTFRVADWRFMNVGGDGRLDQPPRLGVQVDLKEEDSSVYDFDHTAEETLVTPAARTTLPNPYFVSAPTTLAVTTDTVTADTGAQLAYIVFSWDVHPQAFVLGGGRFEAQFKKSADSAWSETWAVEGDRESLRIGPLEKGVNYDVRVRAVNALGVRSSWSALTGFTLGATSAGATNQEDYGRFTQPVTKSTHYGSFSTPVENAREYGEFV